MRHAETALVDQGVQCVAGSCCFNIQSLPADHLNCKLHAAVPYQHAPASSASIATCWKGSSGKANSLAAGPWHGGGGVPGPSSPGGHATLCVHDLPPRSISLLLEGPVALRSLHHAHSLWSWQSLVCACLNLGRRANVLGAACLSGVWC